MPRTWLKTIRDQHGVSPNWVENEEGPQRLSATYPTAEDAPVSDGRTLTRQQGAEAAYHWQADPHVVVHGDERIKLRTSYLNDLGRPDRMHWLVWGNERLLVDASQIEPGPGLYLVEAAGAQAVGRVAEHGDEVRAVGVDALRDRPVRIKGRVVLVVEEPELLMHPEVETPDAESAKTREALAELRKKAKWASPEEDGEGDDNGGPRKPAVGDEG